MSIGGPFRLTWTSVLLVMGAINGPAANGSKLTPLQVDIIPCRPEYLQKQARYLCDGKGTISCNYGWKKSEPEDDPIHPCRVPICNPPCANGKCKAPNTCTCQVGWKGGDCSICIDLPGCRNGRCKGPLTCVCNPGWTGALCSIPECRDCVHGFCKTTPNKCQCLPGWTGAKCDQCQVLPGCEHGTCKKPNECTCDAGWAGYLCNEPSCKPPCNALTGTCIMLTSNPAMNRCNCQVGFSGPDCSECVPNALCPEGAKKCRNGIPGTCDCSASSRNPSHPLCK